jgi:hypothetical protein
MEEEFVEEVEEIAEIEKLKDDIIKAMRNAIANNDHSMLSELTQALAIVNNIINEGG